jgi:lysozyme
MNQTPRVADISHHNVVGNLASSASAGLWGIIHKATQGTTYPDPMYAPRRKLVADAGMLWGAYHFNTGDNVADQVKFFIDKAEPDEDTLMVLDYEDNRLSQMNIHQLVDFCHQIEASLGRKCAIYSGNRLKETISILTKSDAAYVTSHRLWLCQYGPRPKLPPGFSKWWLWQYTGDSVGPLPHSIPGISGNGIDLNAFVGSRDELIAGWSGAPKGL